jgi:4-aminobutyrate aminotransferase/(S)-3-amino-2-methylpropionate transaminase
MGDPIRALQASKIIEVIQRDSLISQTASVGTHLYNSLSSLSSSTPTGHSYIQNLRGKDSGTFLAFDCETAEMRDKFVSKMRENGVNMGGCGERAVRLRPMLVFEHKHADIFLEKVELTLRSL